jgi:hypothetical protein
MVEGGIEILAVSEKNVDAALSHRYIWRCEATSPAVKNRKGGRCRKRLLQLFRYDEEKHTVNIWHLEHHAAVSLGSMMIQVAADDP